MRLIDADALKAEWYRLNDINEEECGARFVGYQEIARLINNAPTVEPTGDIISRADAIDAVVSWTVEDRPHEVMPTDLVDRIKALPSSDAVQGWRIGKPTEQGEYIVTVDSMRHGMVELMYYGKPLMPNRKVRGKCWYRSDDEWGDVLYDDKEILAWMPLPKPYKGGAE